VIKEARNLSKMRIFIADDSPALMESLKTILSEIEGLEIVGKAGNSVEAIKGVNSLKPDVVILDIRLGEGNGILALENIKKMKDPPLVVMFTNFPYLQYRKRCKDAGADYFFYKAIEFKELINLIKKLSKTGY